MRRKAVQNSRVGRGVSFVCLCSECCKAVRENALFPMSFPSSSSTLVNRDGSVPADGFRYEDENSTTGTSTATAGSNDVGGGRMTQFYPMLYILSFFFALFIVILIISYFAWGCARRQKDFNFECLFESKSVKSQTQSR